MNFNKFYDIYAERSKGVLGISQYNLFGDYYYPIYTSLYEKLNGPYHYSLGRAEVGKHPYESKVLSIVNGVPTWV